MRVTVDTNVLVRAAMLDVAFAGRQLGGEVFASFDRQAVALVAAAGGETHPLGA